MKGLKMNTGILKAPWLFFQCLFKVAILLVRYWRHLGRASSLKTREWMNYVSKCNLKIKKVHNKNNVIP